MVRSITVSWITGIGVLLGISYNYYVTTHDYVHVEVDRGVIRGVNTTTWGGTRYHSFKGIRYARPPVGDLRFKAPVEEVSWAGVRDAVYHGSRCPQIDVAFHVYRGDEDCLFLNVYTPSLVNGRLPVMVWIYGGGFIYGSGDDDIYGPDYLLDEGVILVTFNYRLGVFGFIGTDDESAPGNAGMKDQVAALRWVRRNIAQFGGDPDNVTIFGESAGGASVHFHIVSPMSKGLFARAIAQSGSALDHWAESANIWDITKRFAKRAGAPDLSDWSEILRYLRTVPSHKLVAADWKFLDTKNAPNLIATLPEFTPAVEKRVDSEEAFLPSSALSILRSGNYNKVPIIMGYNSEEGLIFANELSKPEVIRATIENPEVFLPEKLTFGDDAAKTKLGQAMCSLYFGNKNITEDDITDIVDISTDIYFASGTHWTSKVILATSDQPIFKYRFSHDGGLGLLRWLYWVQFPGAAHFDDITYLFHHRIIWWWSLAFGSKEELISRTMVRLWTNFAKHGHPTPEGDPVTWRPLSKDEFKCLMIKGDGIVMDDNPDTARLEFWRNACEMYIS